MEENTGRVNLFDLSCHQQTGGLKTIIHKAAKGWA